MYESFFGLRERPFSLAPDPRFLYLAPTQKEALSTLRYGLSSRIGLTLLLGEAGTGKTTLVRTVLAELSSGTAECVLLSNPTLTRAEFYEFLAEGFALGDEAVSSKTRFLFMLKARLQERFNQGLMTALLLDEAQSLSYELLEEIRLLSNVETATTKLLNVVLAGQPELAGRLNDPNLRQLKQRIALRCELSALSRSDTAAYIAGRLRIVGGSPIEIFTREAVETIHAASGGIPRVINVICDNALIGGYAAQVKPVSRAVVEEICRDFDVRNAANPQSGPPAPDLTAKAAAVSAAAPEQDGAKPDAPQGRILSVFSQKRKLSFF
jgi:type II secretory pathway predicted ATPase ExeA